jgi:hypothetical protein
MKYSYRKTLSVRKFGTIVRDRALQACSHSPHLTTSIVYIAIEAHVLEGHCICLRFVKERVLFVARMTL